MKNSSQRSTVLLIILGIVLIIACVAYFLANRVSAPAMNVAQNDQTNMTATTSPSTTTQSQSWKTYSNTVAGFSFQYPSNFDFSIVKNQISDFRVEVRPTKSLDTIYVEVNSDALSAKSSLSSCTSKQATFGANNSSATLYTCAGQEVYYVNLSNNRALTVSLVTESSSSESGLSYIPESTINQIFSSFTF